MRISVLRYDLDEDLKGRVPLVLESPRVGISDNFVMAS